MRRHFLVGAVAATLGVTTAAQAATETVFPGDPDWISFANSGGGSSEIVANPGIDGDGAIELNGDRTRFGFFPAGGLGDLGDVTAFNFDWSVLQTDASGVTTAQAPAFRMHVDDGTDTFQITWEDGEQSSPDRQFVAGAGSLNTVYQGDFFSASASRVYVWTDGTGRGLFDSTGNLIAGSNVAQDFSFFVSNIGADADVIGMSVGAGSAVGSGFQGLADQIQYANSGIGADATYNFAVPTPSAVLGGMMLLGGLALRRRFRAA